MNVSSTYNLAVMYPDVAKQWHPTKNGVLTPFDVTPGSRRKVWWIYSKQHEWQARISDRLQGSDCPYCSGKKPSPEYNLGNNYPQLTQQWHPTKNAPLTPSDVTPGSKLKVWWQCENGHD